MIEQIWQLITTFTHESQKTVFDKCVEFGFDTRRGDITLEESYINLDSCVVILKEAIEKRKLIQLPITVQKVIFSSLDAISTSQTNLIAGSDQVLNLKNHIEALNASMWQYGMFNLSDEVLGYQTKLNQLKQLELEVVSLSAELKDGLKLKKKIEEANQLAQQKLDEMNTSLISAAANLVQINQSLNDSTNANQQMSALLVTAQQSDITITKAKANVVQNDAEVDAIEEKIKEFFAEINDYKSQIITSASTADNAILTNTTKTEGLIEELAKLEAQINDKLQKATGYSLFHSFGTRQDLIKKSKDFWTKVLAGLLVLTACLTIYLINTASAIDTAFFLKLSLSIPIIFAISFASIQYSRERRLEEEYAFKSNISISLIPYQELVEKLVAEDDVEQRNEYATFIMSAINRVFTSPTEEIFKDKNCRKGFVDMKVIKEIGELAQSISKLKP